MAGLIGDWPVNSNLCALELHSQRRPRFLVGVQHVCREEEIEDCRLHISELSFIFAKGQPSFVSQRVSRPLNPDKLRVCSKARRIRLTGASVGAELLSCRM
jgi:hypothetical protein